MRVPISERYLDSDLSPSRSTKAIPSVFADKVLRHETRTHTVVTVSARTAPAYMVASKLRNKRIWRECVVDERRKPLIVVSRCYECFTILAPFHGGESALESEKRRRGESSLESITIVCTVDSEPRVVRVPITFGCCKLNILRMAAYLGRLSFTGNDFIPRYTQYAPLLVSIPIKIMLETTLLLLLRQFTEFCKLAYL
jgi:hypothetical protein